MGCVCGREGYEGLDCVCVQACALACILRGKSWPRGKMLVAVKKAGVEELQKQQEEKPAAGLRT